MSRTRHAIAVTFSLCLIAAVSGGCDEETKATPQVIIANARLESGPDVNCTDRPALFDIGELGNPAANQPSRPVKDQEAFGQGTVSVVCSVTPAGGNEFDVKVNADLSGPTGGYINITGKFRTDGEQTGISAQFRSRFTTNAYVQSDGGCRVRYLTAFQGVAAGRVWGEIECPRAENESAQTSCKAIAEFRFENCSQ